MLPINWYENNIHAIIKRVHPTDEKLRNIRDGKPYLIKGELRINLQGKTYKITDAEFYDEKDKPIKLTELDLDTDVRIAAVIIKGSYVLLFHRIKKDREYYVFPGGHQRVKESDTTTLIRELTEETGIQVKADQLKPFIELTKPEFGTEKYFLLEIADDIGKLKAVNPDEKPGEINRPIWMRINQATRLNNIFPEEVIKKLASL